MSELEIKAEEIVSIEVLHLSCSHCGAHEDTDFRMVPHGGLPWYESGVVKCKHCDKLTKTKDNTSATVQ